MLGLRAIHILWLRNFGESLHLILLIPLVGMMRLAGVLFSVIGDNIYLVYDIQQHNEAGFYMMITSFVILILVFPIYLIKRAWFILNFISKNGSDDRKIFYYLPLLYSCKVQR